MNCFIEKPSFNQIILAQQRFTSCHGRLIAKFDPCQKLKELCNFQKTPLQYTNQSIPPQKCSIGQMSQKKVKQQFDISHTQLTEEDLTISYSRDVSRLIKFEEELTSRKKPGLSSKKMAREISFSSLANISKLFNNCEGNQSFQSVKREEAVNDQIYEETPKLENQTQKSKIINSKDQEIKQVLNSSRLSKSKTKKSDKSMHEVKQNILNKLGEITQLNQKELKTRMKQFQQQIRLLTIHKNFAKSLLKKDPYSNPQIDEAYETRQCPCCQKLITKLCFKCEHTKCKQKGRIEDCPRWKKQRLNAKMLMKLKKKKEEPKEHSRSREKQLRSGTKIKRQEIDKQNISEDEFSSNEWNSYEESIQQNDENGYKLRSRVQPLKSEHKLLNFEKTMTDIPLNESRLFLDSDEQK